MKRIFSVIFVCAIVAMSASAQEETTTSSSNSSSVKPTGKFTIDANFDPAAFFDAAAGSMFQIPYIKGRYFISSDMAVRLGFDIGFSNTTDYPVVDADDYTKTSSTNWTIAPGIEKQYGSNKFFFYLGADLPISSMSSKIVAESGGTKVEAKNPNGGYLSVGLNGVIGADFYLLPNLYVGAEFAPGFVFTKNKDQETDGTVTAKGSKSTSFGLSSSSGVRIGVRF